MKTEVICDRCKKSFIIKSLTERRYMNNGKKWRQLWFNCPHCKQHFDVYNGEDKTKEG